MGSEKFSWKIFWKNFWWKIFCESEFFLVRIFPGQKFSGQKFFLPLFFKSQPNFTSTKFFFQLNCNPSSPPHNFSDSCATQISTQFHLHKIFPSVVQKVSWSVANFISTKFFNQLCKRFHHELLKIVFFTENIFFHWKLFNVYIFLNNNISWTVYIFKNNPFYD